jgi:hypothetical protein
MLMTNRRTGLIARGLVVVAALVLLPLAALLQTPRPGAAQAAAQDSLWAASSTGAVGACLSPGTAAALSDCFQSAASTWAGGEATAAATDGVNVYFLSQLNGALSCPIADLGANCTRIMAGPWPQSYTCSDTACSPTNAVYALAAADGMIWIGQQNGDIIRCPSDLAYVEQGAMPSQCEVLDDAGQRPVMSLLLANGRLYAGLKNYGTEQKKQGILWSCDPQAANSCDNLDTYGKTYAASLAAGGGYLWAGLENGIIWRCNLDTANACSTWETAGSPVISVSYDGQGTLYAAVTGDNGVIWSCPTASANGCSDVLSNVSGVSVAAGDGNVFSSTGGGLYFGSSQFTGASGQFDASQVLYLPAGGPTAVSAADVMVSAGKWGIKLDHRCDHRGRNPKATVTVRNRDGVVKRQNIGLCELRDAATVTRAFNLLDAGTYRVEARTKKYAGSRRFTVEQNQTGQVSVRMTRAGSAK